MLQFGQAEVQQLGARFREHDVERLQIPVRYPIAVGLVQRVGNLDRILQHLLHRQRALLQVIRQRFPLQVLHHQIVDSILMADVEERADVRMIQAGDGARFAIEALAQVRAIGQVRGQDFDRDGAVEPRVASFIDLAHAARADRGEDLVGAHRFSRKDGHAGLRQLKLLGEYTAEPNQQTVF